MNTNIQRVKLAKVKEGDGLEVGFTMIQDDKTQSIGTITHKALVHQKLRKAFNALGIHYAILTGYIKPNQVEDIAKPDPALTESFHVHGYSYGKDEENPGVTITGHYNVPGIGGSTTGNTPYKLFDQAPDSRYMFMDDLMARLKECDKRVQLYLDGTERGQPAQGTLDLPEDSGGKVTKMTIDKGTGGDKVTEEGNTVSEKDKYKYAGKEQMKGVSEMPTGGKKGKQTADNKSGAKK